MALYNNPYQYSFGVPGQMNQFQQQPVQMPAQPVQQPQLKDSIQKVTSGKEMAELNKQIEDKINYLLGYEASKDLFKEPITATTVFGNGQVFAYIVLDKIAEAIAPEIEKRKKKMQAAVNKYTEKYTK